MSFSLPFSAKSAVLDEDNPCERPVTIVTIDTGIDLENKELLRFLKRDNSGKIIGENTRNYFSSIQDFHGHGTEIVSIITQLTECVRIIPISYWDNSLSLKTESFISALEAAIKYKPRIINISGGGKEFEEKEYRAIKRTESHGILIVSSAGNESENIDLPKNQYFPSSYLTKNMIIVTAVDNDGKLGKFSNFGLYSVDISAPGVEVEVTGLKNKKLIDSGTSQATAFVTGVAAKMISMYPQISPSQIRLILHNSSIKKADLMNKTRSGGIIDPISAISYVKSLKLPKNRYIKKYE
jgi:subtilisin family serine protease